MSDRWYVVPTDFALHRDSQDIGDEEEPIMLWFRPVATAPWPAPRALPRRTRGRIK